jgi:transcription antitermination factor NusA-like protein
MKKVLFFILVIFISTSCIKKGKYIKSEPDIVNGKKIEVIKYYYSDDAADYVKLAFINDTLNSTTYNVDKIQHTTINIINKDKSKIINGQILIENDSIVVIKKLMNLY